MAISTTSKVLVDGAVNTVIQFTAQSDGAGQLANEVIADPADFVPIPTTLKLMKTCFTVSGEGTASLAWDAETPEPFDHMGAGSGERCWEESGGMTNTFDPTNGKLMLSTKGFELNSSLSMTLHLRKKY